MTLLRVLLADAPSATRADRWALYTDDGRLLRTGSDVPGAWPSAGRREAVIAARRARLVTLDLPPLPAGRLAAAVAFALEDQLAQTQTPPDIAVGRQRADGSVDAAIAEPALLAGIVRGAVAFARAIPEAALAPVTREWTWYASSATDGFVRTPAGAFAVDVRDTLPPELAVAIAQAARGGSAPPAVHVAFECAPARLARWSREAGTSFVAAGSWEWTTAGAGAYAEAPDWLAQAPAAATQRGAGRRLFRPALMLLVAAFALHAGGTLLQWLGYRVAAWQAGRNLVALARDAGVAEASTPAAAVAALVQRDAEARHRAGQPAPADAWPLLARAAPALAGLPAGALKSATYGAGAWTLEVGVPPAALTDVDHALARAGVGVLQAGVAGGARLRLTALP